MAGFLQGLYVLAHRLCIAIRKEGWITSCKLVFGFLKELVWLDRTVLSFHFATKNLRRLKHPLPNIEIREVTPEDYDELLQCSIYLDRREMFRRFALDHKCIIGRSKNGIVFYGWVGQNEVIIPILGKQASLEPDTGYFYNAYTVDEYRGGRIFPAFVSYARGFCHEIDLRYAFALVNVNRSVRAFARLVGADSVCSVRYRRILGRRIYSEREVSFQKGAAPSKGTMREYLSGHPPEPILQGRAWPCITRKPA